MKCEEIVVNLLAITIILLSLCEARGGRRGGSFGGLFGGWRKYKKPSIGGGNSRRIVSSSPVHTPITKAWHENKKSSDKFNKNFKTNYNMTPLPAGGSYYQSTAGLPGNVIYVPQSPPRGSELGDFLTGYLTGRLLTMGFSSPHYHVTHIYSKDPPVRTSVNKSNASSENVISSGQQEVFAEKVFNAPLHEFTTTTDIYNSEEANTSTTEEPSSTNDPPVPSYGIICVPILLNETNTQGNTVQNERTVCYPAPAPPVPQKDMKSNPVEIAGEIIEN